MEIEFLGGFDEVTGSMTLITADTFKILIDCGLYQGEHDTVQKNKRELKFIPSEIDTVLLTHAHLDHSGFLPRLCKLGFKGQIICTRPTKELADIILKDSAQILEKNIENPLHSFYESKDVLNCMSLFKTKDFFEKFSLHDMEIEFIPAGHILGAASIVMKAIKTIVFSGDLGRLDDALLEAPFPCPKADLIVVESTYGDRMRNGIMLDELKEFLIETKKTSRVGIIACFAVARAQLIIYLLKQLYIMYPELEIPFVVDGPMIELANKTYKKNAYLTKDHDGLSAAIESVEYIKYQRQWESIKKKTGPLLILSSSGMLSGGRVWRSLENWQKDDNSCLLLPGYLGMGTPGRKLSEGIKEIDSGLKKIKWSGKVIHLNSFSSHADQSEILYWVKNLEKKTIIFLNHGEAHSKNILAKKLKGMGFENIKVTGACNYISLT